MAAGADTWLLIVVAIGTLTALQSLDLSGSKVTALPSLQGLTALQTLDLSHSKVTALPSLQELSALRILVLGPRSEMLNDPSLQELRERGVLIH